jgi:hypothetical protein
MTTLRSADTLPLLATDASPSSVAVVDDDSDFARYLGTFLTVRDDEIRRADGHYGLWTRGRNRRRLPPRPGRCRCR